MVESVVPGETRSVTWTAEGGGPALAALLEEATGSGARAVRVRPEVVTSPAVLTVRVADRTPWVRSNAEALSVEFSFELGGPDRIGPVNTGASGRLEDSR